MNSPWQRQRQPDEVPTPVAVAVSDYCRRAKAPATPAEVREALALLPEAEDFRVRALTDGEPEATPLGPFAVVDMLRGTPAALAATRQGCGYYELVQELSRLQERKAAPESAVASSVHAPLPATPPAPEPPEPEPARGSRKAAKGASESIQERIAPRKRAPEPSPAEPAEEPTSFKRDLPRPRGRFTRVAAPRSSYLELLRDEGRTALESGIQQYDHRYALHRAVSEQYLGPRGTELSLEDVDNALRQHGLLELLATKEKDLVLSAYREQKGASGRVAWALRISPSELRQLTARLGLSEQVEQVREHFRREALGSRSLTHRLDLLGRDKYLADLGIQKRFTDSLRKELEALVREELPGAADLPGLARVIGRKHAAPVELVQRALERLGLHPDNPAHPS